MGHDPNFVCRLCERHAVSRRGGLFDCRQEF